jgi:1-acyl-sn-glycerol-3-phosphate acyltransferase
MEKLAKNGPYLLGNSYHTSNNHTRSVFDKLSLGTSAYFATEFIAGLAKNRQMALAGVFDRETWADKSLNVLRLIEDCGGRFYIDGLDNITKIKEPVVFISNHMSMLESMVFPGLIASKRPVTFVVKQSLVTHPLFGPILNARNPITVERKDPIVDFKKVMAEGTENLHKNTSVVIFPQSQRMINFIPEQFNTLGIKLAKKAKVPIVPIAIKTDFWKNGKVIKDIGGINRKLPIHIEFGEPIAIEGAGKNEHQAVIDFITSRLQQWKMD